jgi:hypothetical protein
MKTGTKQLRVRKNTHCIQTAVPCRNHARNILSPSAVPLNTTKSLLKNKKQQSASRSYSIHGQNRLKSCRFVANRVANCLSVFIRVHPWLKQNKKSPNEPISNSSRGPLQLEPSCNRP